MRKWVLPIDSSILSKINNKTSYSENLNKERKFYQREIEKQLLKIGGKKI